MSDLSCYICCYYPENTLEPLYKDILETEYSWSQLHREVYKTTCEIVIPLLIRTLYGEVVAWPYTVLAYLNHIHFCLCVCLGL